MEMKKEKKQKKIMISSSRNDLIGKKWEDKWTNIDFHKIASHLYIFIR